MCSRRAASRKSLFNPAVRPQLLAMSDFRVYCRPPTAEPAQILLSPEESHHLIAVNRARIGDTVVAFDGAGAEWICAVVADKKNAAVLSVRSTLPVRRRAFEITLGQALPKGTSMDAIVRKA